ncbi:ent-kaur-16-ene synthase, chloroplastic isoform X3 [Lolium perenne]|uniref:ent-kaur-16-ene synthase, chloroplastic isoform X3 n=1 Tax=Lolium perenne TaxID=4522 RepID=UPI0021F546F7|nr:9-beta-pimara-7,15-diene synthase, chloroplastic-like isoform X3 [Lolium perenne]
MWLISNPSFPAAVTAPPLSRSPCHHLRANPPRLQVFSRGYRHRPHLLSVPPMRSRTMIANCLAERSLVAENAGLRNKEREARIKRELEEPRLSPSPYDIAWVAMVPLRVFSQSPCFPQCVEWILQNQEDNGSWGIELDLSTSKCTLLSTLACVIALKKWNVGPQHIARGLHFIGTNFSIVMDDQITAPIGFNITFTGMINLAIGMGLEFPGRQTDVDAVLHIRESELNRFIIRQFEHKKYDVDKSNGRESYMAYVAEGLGNLLDWNEVMKFQRKNGSLFNSPSTTAAALIYSYDDKALQYLNLLVTKLGSAVPTVFPLNIYCQLSMVDSLEKIGISRHFSSEIMSILDRIYSLWIQRDDEIMMDIQTCAMAFRILRMNGYDVSADELSYMSEASSFCNSLQGYSDDTRSLLELYKASRVSVSKDEMILENIEEWSGNLLAEKLCPDVLHRTPIFEEVDYALKFPFYATMERLHHRRNIEHFDVTGYQMLKTAYLPCSVKKDHLALATEDFTFSQGIYLDELLDLERWDEYQELQFYSESVKILFCAIYATVNQIGEMASIVQNRDVKEHMIEQWIRTLRSMMTEAEWARTKYVPTTDEYIANAYVSYGLAPIVLPSLYFVGQELLESAEKDEEYNELFRLMSTCGRLVNDLRGLERESSQGKLNSISLLVLHSGGSMSVEAAKKEAEDSIASCRRELLRLVLREGTVVPKPCKELFLRMYQVNHLFYSNTDGLSSKTEMLGAVNAVIYEPLKLHTNNPSLDVKSAQ